MMNGIPTHSFVTWQVERTSIILLFLKLICVGEETSRRCVSGDGKDYEFQEANAVENEKGIKEYDRTEKNKIRQEKISSVMVDKS